MLEPKLRLELQSSQVPEPVIQAIVNAVEFTPRYSDSFEDFEVDPDGSAYIFKVTAMIKPSKEFENHSDVALAVSGASFNAAKVVDHDIWGVGDWWPHNISWSGIDGLH